MRLFEDNINMAYHITARFRPNTVVDIDDIRQLALFGLYKASQNYKEELGFAFSTYAYRVMQNEILKELTRRETCCSLDEMELDVADEKSNPEEEFLGSMKRFETVLTGQEYEIVWLTVQGYSQKDISTRVELSQSQVSRVFIRAKEKIKEALCDGSIAYVGR